MTFKSILLKVAGTIIFIGGGFIGGASQTDGTFFNRLPFVLSIVISFLVMAAGIRLWKRAMDSDLDEE